MRRSFRDLAFAFGLALVLVYMILAAQFESFVHPFTILMAVPLALVAGPLLTRFAGGAYAGSAPALLALLPGIVAFAPGAVLAGDFIGRGRPNWNTQASLLTVLVNLAVGWLLIPEHGAVGAAWSSTIAYTCGSSLMILRFRQTTGLTLRSAFRRRR